MTFFLCASSLWAGNDGFADEHSRLRALRALARDFAADVQYLDQARSVLRDPAHCTAEVLRGWLVAAAHAKALLENSPLREWAKNPTGPARFDLIYLRNSNIPAEDSPAESKPLVPVGRDGRPSPRPRAWRVAFAVPALRLSGWVVFGRPVIGFDGFEPLIGELRSWVQRLEMQLRAAEWGEVLDRSQELSSRGIEEDYGL